MDDSPKRRISIVTTIIMMAVAIIIWGAQVLVAFIPGVDVVLDFILGIFADAVFGVWFFLLGVNYFGGNKSGTKLAALFTTAIVETVPLLDALPALPLGVATLIWAIRKEDAEKIARALATNTSNQTSAIQNTSRYTTAQYYMENMPEGGIDDEEEEMEAVEGDTSREYETI